MNNELCPPAAGLAHITVRRSPAGRFADGQPLTKPRFVSGLHNTLHAIGLPYQDFAGISFRIGAATTAAKVGLEDSRIHVLVAGTGQPLSHTFAHVGKT